MKDSLKKKTFSGILWSGIERFSVQGIQFSIQLVMARILTPADYGLIGMIIVFIAISQSIINCGFSSALIRKVDRTEEDYSTAFYFNIGVGVILYTILFLSAPLIARFYNEPILIPITRIMGLGLLLNSLSIVQVAQLTINLNFKTQAKASFIAAFFSGFIGLIIAIYGYGVWAIVFLNISNTFINVIALWVFSKWVPKSRFSWNSFSGMFRYGSKLLVSGLLDTIYNNLISLIIGKKYSPATLGYYTRANSFTDFPSSNLTQIIQNVTFPVLSKMQEDEDELKSAYIKFIKLSAFIIFPLMTGLVSISNPLINLLLTNKWQDTVILTQILCFSYIWYPIHAINLNLLKVKGRSDLFLKLEIIRKALGIITLFITVPLGVKAMCIGVTINSVIALIINTHYSGKFIQFGFFAQMKILFPILANALTMMLFVIFINSFINGFLLQLIVGISAGATYYLGISYIFNSKELSDILSVINLNVFSKR